MKLIIIITLLAILAFLIALCVIYFDNVKQFVLNKIKFKKKKTKAKAEPKPVANAEDFKPLLYKEDEYTRDPSLDALFADDKQVELENKAEDVVEEEPIHRNDFDFLMKRTYKKNSNKSLSEQIKDLSPELKALLLDSTLKKRDDV